MGVSKNNGTPKSSILKGFSIINHPFWGKNPYFWKHPNEGLFFGGDFSGRKSQNGSQAAKRARDHGESHENSPRFVSGPEKTAW